MPGTYPPGTAYPGQYDAGGPTAYTLTVDGAAIAVTGGDVTFIYTPFIAPMIGGWALGTMYPGQYYNQQNQAYTLTAVGASVAVTGGTVDFVYTPGTPAENAVGPLLRHRRRQVAAKRYRLTLKAGHVFATGGTVTFRGAYRLPVEPIRVPVTGGQLRLSLTSRFAAGAGVLRVARPSPMLRVHRLVAQTPASMSVRGAAVTFRYDEAIGVAVLPPDADPVDRAWSALQASQDDEALLLLGAFD